MGFLDKLFHRTPEADPVATAERPTCLHGALVPRWDDLADMGQEDKVTSYRCDSCGDVFSPAEADALRLKAVDRIRDVNEPPSPN